MPTIGKDALKIIEKTRVAMVQLEQDLAKQQPETIVIISPHGESLADAVSINLSAKYITNFQEFGDLVTKTEWKSDMMLIDGIREDFKDKHLPLVLGSSEFVDYGCAVPLAYLTKNLPNVRVVPLLTSQLDMKTHYTIGKELKDEIMSATKRVAVIASADLSHRVAENSPDGVSPRGVAFDEKVTEMVTKGDFVGVLDIDDAWTKEAQACGSKVLATMAGVMDGVKSQATLLSYEKPFGVGYLVAKMEVG